MRYIYIDEAGTSANEPVSVVAGIIVHADLQWRLLEQKLTDALSLVPDRYKTNFVFHAKEIWGSQKYRGGWPMKDRLDLLHAVMSIPRQTYVPITMAIVRRSAPEIKDFPIPMSKSDYQHCQAFAIAIAGSDDYMREYTHQNEVATVVAEDVPEKRRLLSLTVNILRSSVLDLSAPGMLRMTRAEQRMGRTWQSPITAVTRVVDEVHFSPKGNSPLLQIADACAFAFRRYFAGQSHGLDFLLSTIGKKLIDDDWSGPQSWGLFYPWPRAITVLRPIP